MHLRQLSDVRIEVTGDEALEWLMGQLTCDVGATEVGGATYGLLLTAHGKPVSDTWVLRAEDRFYLVLPQETADDAVARLDRFLVMEDVDLVREERVVLSFQGEGAIEAATTWRDKVGLDQPVWPVSRLGSEGAELWMAPTTLSQHDFNATAAAAWEDARIHAAIPRMGHEITENALPQELGLYHAVSFKKGCYVGQEPVVMLEHRGKPRTRLVRLTLPHAPAAWAKGKAPTAGSQLLSEAADSPSAKAMGTVTSVGTDVPYLLARVRRKHLDADLPLWLGETKLGAFQISGTTEAV